MESLVLGLSLGDVRRLVSELGDVYGIDHPFNASTQKAGSDWLVGFRMRHPSLALITPEATSGARAKGFNCPNRNKFFDLLEGLFDKHPYPPSRIYNCDETKFSGGFLQPAQTWANAGVVLL